MVTPVGSISSTADTYHLNSVRARDVNRINRGLVLIVIGILLLPLPYVTIVGWILLVIGATLILDARDGFPQPARSEAVAGCILLLSWQIVAFASALAAASAIVFAGSGSVRSDVLDLAYIGICGGVVMGIGCVLLTARLSDSGTRLVLYSGALLSVGIAVLITVLLLHYVNPTNSDSVDLVELLRYVPNSVFAFAYIRLLRDSRGDFTRPILHAA